MLRVAIFMSLFFLPFISLCQISVTPRVSANHNHFDWNSSGNDGFADLQEWTFGVGLIARAQLNSKIFVGLSFNYYPLGYDFTDLNTVDPYRISANIVDIRLGIECKIYPNTFLGIGFEIEQYLQIQKIILDNSEILFSGNQKHYGFETSLTQRFGKIELFADVFIGLNEGEDFFFLSHKKLQLGIGIPISLK